ncbi:transcription factor bHLH128 [Citrus sinensis]|uniref:Transcription factor bHLH128 n=1 Tax=Citrus sinensis TaxID=2711 RepID=A0ACB8MDC1_CITSI|nr:transcription factor bHLH128 isoform X2 [Citrus x clementina]KAH9783873.1 transcription factor bHLH128 [Citrus sinensis]
MYHHPSSSSSSQQNPMGPTTAAGVGGSGGLTRYVSAPGSLLRTAVDSIIGSSSSSPSPSQPSIVSSSHSHQHHHYFAGGSTTTAGGDSSPVSSFTTTESTCKVNSSNAPGNNTKSGLQRSYGLNDIPQTHAASSSSSLLRQRSSPAGFLSHFASENGFSVTRETGNYNSQGRSSGGLGVSRLKSQLSFTGQDSLSQISEESENGIDGVSSGSGRQNATHSYSTASFGMDSWENGTSIVFSAPPSKRTKTLDGDIFNCLNALDSQFTMPQTSLEMATVDNLLNIPEDSVPCKIRAKRGCATHPRSIAERERRTRISRKLKKLQDLVPNMDKQTSYSDMLDLAVQHIKGLQNQVENLHKDLEHCTCGCKPTS